MVVSAAFAEESALEQGADGAWMNRRGRRSRLQNLLSAGPRK